LGKPTFRVKAQFYDFDTPDDSTVRLLSHQLKQNCQVARIFFSLNETFVCSGLGTLGFTL